MGIAAARGVAWIGRVAMPIRVGIRVDVRLSIRVGVRLGRPAVLSSGTSGILAGLIKKRTVGNGPFGHGDGMGQTGHGGGEPVAIDQHQRGPAEGAALAGREPELVGVVARLQEAVHGQIPGGQAAAQITEHPIRGDHLHGGRRAATGQRQDQQHQGGRERPAVRARHQTRHQNRVARRIARAAENAPGAESQPQR